MRRPDSHTPRRDSPQPPQPEAALLDLLLSPNGGARDNALSALGDQVERFKCIARDFNLTRTASFVEEPSSHCGTSIFDVDTRRTVIPSIKEISITFSSTPTSASTPQEVSISLTCLLQADTPREEVEVLRKALSAYTPETVLHDPPSISISIHNHRVDAVRDLEAIFELIHKPCGVHPNMNIAVLTRAILELPELNHRAIEIFRSRLLKVATDYRDHGPPENEKALNKLLVQAIRAQGAISLFEAPDHLLSESSVHHWAGATKVLIDTVFLHREGLVPCQSIDYLAEVMRDFAQQEDLRGMCGIASVLAIGRQEAILAAHYGDDFFDISHDEQLLNSTKEREVEAYQKLLDESLAALTGLARTAEDALRIEALQNLIISENETFDRNLIDANRHIQSEPAALEAPVWVKNNLALTIALHSAPKHPDVAEVFSDLVPELRSMQTNLGADLVAYGIMNPSLQQAILEVIRADSLLTSAEQLIERIHARLKELLPPEATTSIKRTVNYLAEEFALAHDVGGYKLGLGIYRED